MGKANHFKVGDIVYVYFGDQLRKHLRKSVRKQNIYFAEYKVIDSDANNENNKHPRLIIINVDKLCNKFHPYGGYGLAIYANDAHLFTEESFRHMRNANDDELRSMCKTCNFKFKEFSKGFEPFRHKPEVSEENGADEEESE
jgi:hypothetical protein